MTNRDRLMRGALRATAVMNAGGALLFAFPQWFGWLAGFPATVPRVYAFMLAFLVALFGATYAWLAGQPRIDRPLVVFSALGKAGVFFVVLACWWLGDVPGLAVFTMSADLAFATFFVWWLLGSSDRAALPT